MAEAVENGMLPRIGAQFFVNPEDSPEDVKKHFSLMEDYGIRLVRLFLLWDQVEKKPGEWDFSRYDFIYDEAQKHGIRIVATLTAEDPPAWFEKKVFYHHYTDLNRKEVKEAAAVYIEKTVSRYCSHPAHYAWILMNEPELAVNQNEETMELFRLWLKKRYQTIDRMNRKWYQSFRSFEEVTVMLPGTPEYWQCFQAFTDWHTFLKENLCSQLNWIQEEIRKKDELSPTHLNPKGFFGNLAPVGQDYFQEGKISDILGASIHPAWKFLWFEREEYGLAFSFCVDLIRSAARGKSFWVTELQAGPTIMTGVQPCTPTPKELYAWLWDAVGAGAKAVLYWMWHPRTGGQEAGEWGITTADHKVTKRLQTSARVSGLLEKNRKLFEQAVPVPAKAAIFYNHATEVLSLIEGSPLYRRSENPIKALCGVYLALMKNHIPVDFITEKDVKNGELAHYDTVYLPYAYALDEEVQEKLRVYVKEGGRVWADTPLAMKNSSGETFHRKEDFYHMFGMDLTEFQGCMQTNREKEPYFCQAEIEVLGAETESRFADGTPALLYHSFGKGETCFVNSTVSLGYFMERLETFEKEIVNFAKKSICEEIIVSTSGTPVISRFLHSEEERILILENWSEEKTDCVLTSGSRQMESARIITPESQMEWSAGSIKLMLEAKESAVLALAFKKERKK